MRSRIELDDILRGILGSDNVYFDPPKDSLMHYPCIRYSLAGIDSTYADNAVFMQTRRYNIVTIDDDPDSVVPLKVSQLPYCRPGTPYVADGLHHQPFVLNW